MESGPATEVWDCTGESCSKKETINGLQSFYLIEYHNELYYIGNGKDYRNGARVFKGQQSILPEERRPVGCELLFSMIDFYVWFFQRSTN